MKLAIACCKLYISESRNASALLAIQQAAAQVRPLCPLLHSFSDPAYNRVGFTLAASIQASDMEHQPPSPLHHAVLDIVRTAFQYSDLRQHSGAHPRLGVVDHICFQPLGAASLPMVAAIAYAVARDIGSDLQVPTYLYGAAHPKERPLHDVRRAMGYFIPDVEGHWVGSNPVELTLLPDFGPLKAQAETGIVVIGASPWIANYNVPILSDDLELCRRISRQVSARGGGLPAVQAMALRHGENVIEIACNLLDSKLISADLVQEEVIRLAEKEGLSVEKGYFTDCSAEEITDMASLKLGFRRC